jgi:DNA-binding NtrC family response regulator
MNVMNVIALFSRDPKLQRLLSAALGKDYNVIAVSDSAEVFELANSGTIDLLLIDVDIEASTPEEYINLYDKISQSDVSAVVMADDSGRSVGIDLVQRGAHSSCRKPPALRELEAILRRAIEHTAIKRRLKGKQPRDASRAEAEGPACDNLIGSSAPMRNIYGLIHRVADLNVSVLVTGESGTGKELIARAIHNTGTRRNQPFVAVSCGAIPETLIESELFGHEKGAFTGSAGTRLGYFEQAGQGTLFLDEIGELSPQTQVKLLRILQQKEFTRLGSGRAIPLKARVIFATHRNLSQMVAEGKFRQDLFYRVNVTTIHSPSLAERPEDIGALTCRFLAQYSEAYNKHAVSISPTAMRIIEEYEWPGNVRELENVIQSAIICAKGDEIQANELPEHMRSQEIAEHPDVLQAGRFERLIRDYKIRLALKAIEDNQGNKTMAARSLDISRAYLHRLIRPGEAGVIRAA